MQQNTNEYIVFSNFMKNKKEAVVIKHKASGSWGVVLKEEGRPDFTEYYPNHSETWAENCAENFVEGIKVL